MTYFMFDEIFQMKYWCKMKPLASFCILYCIVHIVSEIFHRIWNRLRHRMCIAWKIMIIDHNYHTMINGNHVNHEMLVFINNLFHTYFLHDRLSMPTLCTVFLYLTELALWLVFHTVCLCFCLIYFLSVWLYRRFAGMDGIGKANLGARGKPSPGRSNYQTVTPAYIGTQRDTALVLHHLCQLLFQYFIKEFGAEEMMLGQTIVDWGKCLPWYGGTLLACPPIHGAQKNTKRGTKN